MTVLYHYTSKTGLDGISATQSLWASTAQSSPADIRYGEGQYLTDNEPSRMSLRRLSRYLIGNPFQGSRFTHFVAIDVSGLTVIRGRPGVYVIPNRQALDLRGRIIDSGENHALP